jgi:hypothetical protein
MHSDAQIVVDANRRAGQRATRNDAQIAADANQWAAQRVTHNNAQIALENVAHANARMLLHFDRQ